MDELDSEHGLEEEASGLEGEPAGNSLHTRGFGTLRLGKGKLNSSSLFFSWDAVPICRELDCPIVESCTYAKGPRVKCHIHHQFLRSLSVMLYRNYADILDESKLYRVGMHMMPLYKMLCKLLIEEHAVRNAVYSDDKGVIRAHPIFKEVRDTLQAISKEWRALGLGGAGGAGAGISIPPAIDPFEHGDPNFHASLESDTPRRMNRRGDNV